MRLWLKITIGVVLFLLLLGGVYLYSLSKVDVKKVNIKKLEDVSLQGFTLSGYVELYNGGFLPVKVDKIHYEVFLEADYRKIAEADIEGEWIMPKNSVKHNFETRIYWKTTAEMIINLIQKGATYAQIKGTAYIGGLEIDFVKRVDLEEYLKQFISEKAKSVVGKVVEVVREFI